MIAWVKTRYRTTQANLIVILVLIFIAYGIFQFVHDASGLYQEKAPIETSLSVLPLYGLMSLVRSFIGLFLSYLFSIVFVNIILKYKSLESIFIPILDILQSLPVVAFLPGFVLALIAIFPHSRWGIEFACILTIFTGQVWSLAFAYFESRITMPPAYQDVANVYQLSKIEKFFYLNLANGLRPLVYNGMMSMAGGWFFLTTCESFTLGKKDFRLPGIGSYINETFNQGLYSNFIISVLFLILIIVGTDIFLWKPLVAWVAKYKESEEISVKEKSWFYNIMKEATFFKKSKKLDSKSAKQEIENRNTQYTQLEKETKIQRISKNIHRLGMFIDFSELIEKKQMESLKRSRILQWGIIFCVGGLAFHLLTKLPAIGYFISTSTIKQEDWVELIHKLAWTTGKVFCVLIISSLWTIPFGIWLSLNSGLEKIFQPIIQYLAAFPFPVLFPLLVMYLIKLDLPPEATSTILMLVGSQWYILFNVLNGGARISFDLKNISYIYKLNLWQKFTKLYLPAILPSLSTGWITAAGGAWNASIVAEVVKYPEGTFSSQGIGEVLTNTSAAGDYEKLLAAIACLVIALVVLNRTLWHTIQLLSERSVES